jgi:DNA-binding transcriptional MerR regulator
MPLEATHIRFALDLQNKYKIKDLGQYLAGTIYPDSHYLTGIDRELVHGNRFLLPGFATNDFNMGWQVHQICDLVFDIIVEKRLFSNLFSINHRLYNEQNWIILTALKAIQDMNDVQLFDIQKYLELIQYAHNPNGENIAGVDNYNKIVINRYKNKAFTTVEENIDILLKLGVKSSLCKQIRVKTEEFLQNQKLLDSVKLIYGGMINSYFDIVKERILDEFGDDES